MTNETGAYQVDPRSQLRRKLDAAWKEAKWQTYLLYCRTLYRPHMRLIHRQGLHWWKHHNLIGGPEFDKCEWCGAIRSVAVGEQLPKQEG